MYTFPGTYYHPWWRPRDCETEAELLALLATDERWRETPYPRSEGLRLRAEWERQQAHTRAQESAAMHAALVARARNLPPPASQDLPPPTATPVLPPASGREWPSFLEEYLARSGVRFKEGTRVIENDTRGIVIRPGNPWADIFLWLSDGSFQWQQQVPAADVMPGGWIRLPEPPTPLSGMGRSVPPLPKKKQPAALDLTETEWQTLSPSPKKSRARPRRYPARDPFVADLGYVLDAWRFYRPGKDPTLEELGNTPLPDGVIAAGANLGLPALWPLGMSRSALVKLLGKKDGYGIDLEEFKRERPRLRRT